MIDRQPVVFVGHGSPMNIIADNGFTRELRSWGAALQGRKPRAILAISAHWYVRKTAVMSQAKPGTIYDFGGFPQELYQIEYPAPGAADLVRRVQELVPNVVPDATWGLDHGTWGVLVHLFPTAQVPVVQFSIDRTKAPLEHWQIAEQLRPLRDDGYLILASGNLVHSFSGLGSPEDAPPHPLGVEFLQTICPAIVGRDRGVLCDYKNLGSCAQFSAPTPDHYLPVLYAVGASEASEPVMFHCDLFQHGTISHLSFQIG